MMMMMTEVSIRLLVLITCVLFTFGRHANKVSLHNKDGRVPIAKFSTEELRSLYGFEKRRPQRQLLPVVKPIICYTCTHQLLTPNIDCAYPFYEHSITTVNCKGKCVLSIYKQGENTTKISRACWTSKCAEVNEDNLLRKCCDSDHCNSANVFHNSPRHVILMMMMMVVKMFCVS